MNNRIRYTVDKVLSNSFYQMPKFLFEGEFKSLSNDARVLYTLLKDRHELSVKNQWYNAKNEVYLIMKREEMESMLNLSPLTTRKVLKELKDLHLIEEERQGMNKPNLLYLLECQNITLRNVKNSHSETSKSNTSERQNLTPNHTNQKNHNDHSNNKSINQESPVKQQNPTDLYDSTNNIKSNIERNINLNNLNLKYLDRKKEIQKIYEIIFETLVSQNNSFRISKKNVPASTVKQALQNLNHNHIEFVLSSLQKNNSDIKNSKAYLLTTLFNASVNNSTCIDVDCIEDTVKNNIQLDNLQLKHPNKRRELQELCEIITEVLISRKKSFRIAREDMPADVVKQAFSSLDRNHIEYVLECLSKNTTEVKSTKAYLQTALFNANKTIDNYYSLSYQYDAGC